MTLWGYVRRGPAEKAWKKWLAWALGVKLSHAQGGEGVRSHLWGILNAIIQRDQRKGRGDQQPPSSG